MRGPLFLALSLFSLFVNAQNEVQIDHVTIAVKDLNASAKLSSSQGFTLKKPHTYLKGVQAGLITQSIRFKNGQYLQLVSPKSGEGKLAQWYQKFLKQSGGGATLVLRHPDLQDLEKKLLLKKVSSQYLKNNDYDWLSFKTNSPYQHLSFINYKKGLSFPEELFNHASKAYGISHLVLSQPGDAYVWADILTTSNAQGIGLEFSPTTFKTHVFIQEIILKTSLEDTPRPFWLGDTKISFKSQ